MAPTEEEEAAAAAEGRKVGSYEVAGRPLIHNGQSYNEGDIIKLSNADADILIGVGRLQPAKDRPAKAKKAD